MNVMLLIFGFGQCLVFALCVLMMAFCTATPNHHDADHHHGNGHDRHINHAYHHDKSAGHGHGNNYNYAHNQRYH